MPCVDQARTPQKVVIGRDTRISGDMLEAALVAGICSVGVNVYKVGVLPTPAIAYLTKKLGAGAGVVISAPITRLMTMVSSFSDPAATSCPMNWKQRLRSWY
ncbi:hypothetical protein N752_10725 [Desulforamulus aquiferis]|nr:hypothetical protein N752_10725 [Desulforamulus aquiferis]